MLKARLPFMLAKLSVRPLWLVCAITVFTIPLVLYYTYLLNHFYDNGGGFFDGGLFAHVMWRNDWKLSSPWLREPFSFLGAHFMPIFWVANLFSYVLPLYVIEFFSLYTALTYAFVALSMFYALRYFIDNTRWQIVLTAVIALATGFNSLIVNALWIPHVEFSIPFGIFLFLMHYALGNYKMAIAAFIFTLSIREDGGFHLAAPLGLLMLADYYRNRNIKQLKRHLRYLCIAIAWSICALWLTLMIRQIVDAQQQSLFRRIYLGSEPFSHMSWGLLWERLKAVGYSRLFLWLAILVMASRALQSRDLILGIGLLAYIPWMILHLMASYPPTSIMYAYYIFPFMLFAFWPILAAFWRYGRELSPKVKRDTLILQAVVTLLFSMSHSQPYLLMARPDVISRFMPTESLNHREKIQQVVQRYEFSDLQRKSATSEIFSLSKMEGKMIYANSANLVVQHLFYMSHDRESASPKIMALAQSNRLVYRYCLEKTSLCLLSQHPREKLGSVVEGLVDAPIPEKWHNHPRVLKLWEKIAKKKRQQQQ